MTDPSPGGELETKSRQVAYLTNLYPAPSHSFIRREIAALEAAGWLVHRFAHRRAAVRLVDPADLHELPLTIVLLELPVGTLALSMLRWLVESPFRTVAAMRLAMQMARNGDRRYVAHAAYFAMACTLSRRLRALGCTHLHVHFGTNPASVACLAHRLCGLRFSATFHGPHEFEPRQKQNLRVKVGAAAFVVAVSAAGLRKLMAEHGQFAAKFRHISCGLDAKWFAALPPRERAGTDLVCVARLEDQKDPLLLLEAAAILVERGLTFRLRIAGDGSLRARMAAYVNERALGEHVLMFGWQSQQEVFEHLRTARALVLSSRDEGLPVAIMEAFSLGVPAIAPDVGGVNELVETGLTGWLIAPSDSKSLADAMQACVLAASAEILRMGAEARRRVTSYDVRTSARALADEFCAGTA